MTPHINAKKGDFAKLVLMPGDPLRAKYIADNFLTNVQVVNSVRNMLMYTGEYKGQKVSICGSGMGQPSMGIYAYELYKFFGVESIVRIGSAGSFKKDLQIYDIVLATSAYSFDKSFGYFLLGEENKNVFDPSKNLNNKIEQIAKNENIKLHTGRVYSSNIFYSDFPLDKLIELTGSDCVEMEAAALFAIAKKLDKQAAALLTISDELITKKEISPEKRQKTFNEMIELALKLSL